MTRPSSRLTYLIGFIAISLLLGTSVYLQTHEGMTPCPLCILQRIMLGLLGVVFFFGAALNLKKNGRLFISILACTFASLGVLLAGRQVWLQHLPVNQNADCSASLQYMLQALPLTEVLQKILTGSAECSEVSWQWLNLSLADWSLGCFIFLLIVSIWQFCRILFRQPHP